MNFTRLWAHLIREFAQLRRQSAGGGVVVPRNLRHPSVPE